jgi:hypothetical protein
MSTLKDVLVRRYGYGPHDFGSAGLVRLDLEEGTLSPVPLRDIFTPTQGEPAKVVHLADLFRSGQEVTLTGIGRAPTRRFAVTSVMADGLEVRTAEGRAEHMPWSALRHGLMRPELLVFGPEPDVAKKVAKSLCTSPRLAL